MKAGILHWVLLWVIVLLFNGCSSDEPDQSDIHLIAHRGSSYQYPENSAEAIQVLIPAGITHLETDLVFTSDDSVVLFHDYQTDRLTTFNQPVIETPTARLRSGFFNQTGGTLLTFEQFARRFGSGFDRIYLDLKWGQGEAVYKVIRQVVTLSSRYNLDRRLVVTSTNANQLDSIRALNPDIQVAYDRDPAGLEICIRNHYPMLLLHREDVSPDIVKGAASAGVKLVGYGYTTLPDLQAAVAVGLTDLMTDNPIGFKSWFD